MQLKTNSPEAPEQVWEKSTETGHTGFILDQIPVCFSTFMYFFFVLRKPLQMTKLTMPLTVCQCTVYPVGVKTQLCFALVLEQKLLFCEPPKCSQPLCRITLTLKQNKLCTVCKTIKRKTTYTNTNTHNELISPCSFFYMPQK